MAENDKLIISDKDLEDFKTLENEIAETQRKIGDLDIQKAQYIKRAEQTIEKFREFQIYLYKKHELNMSKSYTIDMENKKFVLVEK